MNKTYRTTLLALVQAVQDHARSDAEVIAVIVHMIKTGRVALSEDIIGQRIERELVM